MNDNKYDYLKVMDDSQAEKPSVVQSTMMQLQISDDPKEQIFLLTTRRMGYTYVAGYSVYWASGKKSLKVPSNDDGFCFRTIREARLYTIGFLRNYARHFTPANREAIARAELEISQQTLF